MSKPSKPLYRYRNEHGHHVSLPYNPEKLPERMRGKLTHLPDHAAVDKNGRALPAKPNINRRDHSNLKRAGVPRRQGRVSKGEHAVSPPTAQVDVKLTSSTKPESAPDVQAPNEDA